MRSLVSNSIYAKKDRNGPPSANQVASKDEPRCGHAVCTLQVHLPTSPYAALSAFFYFIFFILFYFFYCKQICAEVSKHSHQGVAKK